MRRQPLRKAAGGHQIAQPVNWVAPVDGWRTDKPLAALPPTAASTLINWFPEAGYIRARNGSAAYATGMPSSVQTLMAYSGATNKMFAASGAGIYEVTGGGAVGAALVSGLTNSRWSWAQFTNAGGKWLPAVNGADAPQIYNGTSWASMTVTGPGSISNLSAVATYRSRLWFLEKNTTRLWYSATDAISGALTSIEVGDVMKYGGTLVALAAWTAPTANGVLQFLVLMSSQGELVVYQGSNPADSTNWSLLGTFKLSLPLGGTRSLFQIGGDLAILTANGVVPITKAITIDASAEDQNSLTKKIAPTWREIVQTVGLSGYELVIYPQGRMAIVNVPDTATDSYQVVMNTETLAWTKFTGMPARTWVAWNNGLYFGTANGTVVQADYGSLDQGASIDCLSVGAWTRLTDNMANKQTSLISVDAIKDANASVSATCSFNYTNTTPALLFSSGSSQAVALWDTALWDVAIWPGSGPVHLISSCDGVGYVFAPTIRALINGQTAEPSACQVVGGAVYVMPGAAI